VNAIATDPPWGLYEGGMGKAGAEELVDAFLAEAARLLPPGGRLVFLLSRSLEAASPVFELRESFDVLVSGKKAKALRFDRV
jgi:tRNA G10  N-methylase Trm11